MSAFGFTSATVTNRAGAKIGDDVAAISLFNSDETSSSTVDTLGPGFPANGTPGALDSFSDVRSYSGNIATIDNFGSIGAKRTSKRSAPD